MDIRVLCKKGYKFEMDQTQYKLEFLITERHVIFKIYNPLNISNDFYQCQISFENLRKLSPFFQNIKTVDQYDKLFDDIFTKNQFTLRKLNENLHSYIIMKIDFIKDKIIEFKLLQQKNIDLTKSPDKNECNKKLIRANSGKNMQLNKGKNEVIPKKPGNLDYILNKLSQQEKLIMNLNDTVNTLQKQNSFLIDKVNKLELYISQEKIKKENKNWELFQGNNSHIFESEEEKKFLKEILPKKKFKLLYRATEDGDTPKIFHKKVDKIGETITLFKTDKNRKFGGHITKAWNNSGDWEKRDPSYFLFSFDEKKVYKPIDDNCFNENVFYCAANCGPYFYNIGINVGNSILKYEGGFEWQNLPHLGNLTKDYELTGENKFTCVEVEVYQVIN